MAENEKRDSAFRTEEVDCSKKKRIGAIKFALLSPEEMRKMSVMKVLTPDTYNEEDRPIPNGLMDTRMGVIEPGLKCATCGQKMYDCLGHFGHIELARPIIHVGFVKEIKKLMEVTCQHCGKLLLSPDEIEKYKEEERTVEDSGNTLDISSKLKGISKIVLDDAVCPYCGKKQIKFKLDKPTNFRITVEENGKNVNKVLPPHEIRERLERISDEDLRTLGYDPTSFRPEWMVLKVLLVPPVRVRPTIIQGSRKQEDDLTHKLVDIIKINHKLGEQRDAGSPLLILEDLWNLLQLHVTTYLDNQTSGAPPANHRGSTRPLKTLTQRLKGKDGRFRSNLSGKRVNFSARTVISPDPLLSINEVGVPIEIARELTVPERVNENNLEEMKKLVARGNEPFEDGRYVAGVNYVVKNMSGGRTYRKSILGKEIAENVAYGPPRPDENGEPMPPDENGNVVRMTELGLVPGDIVERQLQDGDIVLFNRQPSLHRMSMMAHEVRVMKGHTFRFNLCDCPPYNADFDGDEMNLHVLQSIEARAEARIIMRVQENILSPRYGGPIIGAIHDHITGAYFLTHDDGTQEKGKKSVRGPFFNKFETMNILTKLGSDIEIPEPDKVENGQEYWSGKTLFSLVLPKTVNVTFKSAICSNCKECKKEKCENDAYVKIVDGKLECGTIDVNAIGNSKGKLIEDIAHVNGLGEAAKFINNVTRIALGAIMNHGFSTGIDDEDISSDDLLEIEDINEEKIKKVNELVESYKNDTLEQMPGRTLLETMEMLVQKELSDAVKESGKSAENSLGKTNPAVIMAKTGARGSMLNLSQMAGCVGQQTVRGNRLSRGYRDRTLTHFVPNDLGAFSRGYVIDSYKKGLTPTEFFFHAMGGREGLVDTAVRTSRSGYMQRRLISALEDLRIAQDKSVRNTVGNIIQFKYGEDGNDPTKTIRGKAIDYDNLFIKVFGEKDAERFLDYEVGVAGENYAEHESNNLEIEETESEYGESESTDYGGE